MFKRVLRNEPLAPPLPDFAAFADTPDDVFFGSDKQVLNYLPTWPFLIGTGNRRSTLRLAQLQMLTFRELRHERGELMSNN
jgi:hypothetical protein